MAPCTKTEGPYTKIFQTDLLRSDASLFRYLQDIQYHKIPGSENWSPDMQRAQPRRFVDFYSPPCCGTLAALELILASAYKDLRHIEPRIRIDLLIPTRCCRPGDRLDSLIVLRNRLKKEKTQLKVRQLPTNPRSRSKSSSLQAIYRCEFYDVKYLELQIYQLECMSNKQLQDLKSFCPNFLDTIMERPDTLDHWDELHDRYLFVEFDSAVAASKAASCTILPPPRPFKKNEIYQYGSMENQNNGEVKPAWFYRGDVF